MICDKRQKFLDWRFSAEFLPVPESEESSLFQILTWKKEDLHQLDSACVSPTFCFSLMFIYKHVYSGYCPVYSYFLPVVTRCSSKNRSAFQVSSCSLNIKTVCLAKSAFLLFSINKVLGDALFSCIFADEEEKTRLKLPQVLLMMRSSQKTFGFFPSSYW